MHSFLGFLHWQVRPRGVACPFAAGSYCWSNGEQARHTPVAVLESLVVLQSRGVRMWQVSRPCNSSLDCTDLT